MGHPGLMHKVQQVDIDSFMTNSWLEKKFDFSNNFVSKNSVKMQNFRSWLCRVENLVDCSVSGKERNAKRVLVDRT